MFDSDSQVITITNNNHSFSLEFLTVIVEEEVVSEAICQVKIPGCSCITPGPTNLKSCTTTSEFVNEFYKDNTAFAEPINTEDVASCSRKAEDKVGFDSKFSYFQLKSSTSSTLKRSKNKKLFLDKSVARKRMRKRQQLKTFTKNCV